MKVFDGQAADGNSTVFKDLIGNSAKVNIYVSGDLGGGTINLEAELPDESGWVPVVGVSITAPGMVSVEAGYFVGRLALTGATTPSVNAWVESENVTLKQRVLQDT